MKKVLSTSRIAGDAKDGYWLIDFGRSITLGKAADKENAATAVAINVAKDVTATVKSTDVIKLTNAAFANAGS